MTTTFYIDEAIHRQRAAGSHANYAMANLVLAIGQNEYARDEALFRSAAREHQAASKFNSAQARCLMGMEV